MYPHDRIQTTTRGMSAPEFNAFSLWSSNRLVGPIGPPDSSYYRLYRPSIDKTGFNHLQMKKNFRARQSFYTSF